MRIAGIVALGLSLGLSLLSVDARANTRAWSAAKAGLPADARIVVGMDVAALRKTQVFAALLPRLLDKADADSVFKSIKAACKTDPVAMMQSAVIATSEDQEHGAVYIALAGIDRARLSSCVQAAAQQQADKDVKVTIKHDGNVMQMSDGTESVFLGWVGKDVLVLPIKAQDRAELVKWTGGKGALAKSPVGKRLAKVNTAAALWVAADTIQEVQSVTIKGGYAAVTFSKGNLDADVRAVAESAAQATTLATTAQQRLDEARQIVLLPPAVGAVLRGVTIGSAAEEVVLKANVPEGDLVSALNLALEMAGP
jgi:hypothetical protein